MSRKPAGFIDGRTREGRKLRAEKKQRAEKREQKIADEIKKEEKESISCSLCYTQMIPCNNPYGLYHLFVICFFLRIFFVCGFFLFAEFRSKKKKIIIIKKKFCTHFFQTVQNC